MMHKLQEGEFYITHKNFYIYLIEGWEATIFERFVDGQFYGHVGDVQEDTRKAALHAAKELIDDNFQT